MTVTFLNDETRSMTEEERAEYEYPVEETRRVKFPAYEEFRGDVLRAGSNATMVSNNTVTTLIMDLISISFLGFMVIALIAMMRSGPLAMLNSGGKDMIKQSDVRFSDVIGQDEVIEDLKFIVSLMKDPSMGDAVGAKIPKGLLLQGPPGTGKTMLAKAVAGEAGVPFIEMSGSAFIEMYVGLGAKRVRDLFKLARKNAPCIVFIDEIDAIGLARDSAKASSEHEQTINAMLEQMDGFTARDGVFIIAATNRADQLDEALIRPGRFDRQVTVNPPRDWRVRKEMFDHYLEGLSVSDDIDVENMAKQTPGFTGADIAMICNEAGIIATMKGLPAIDMSCLEEAIDKKVFKGNRSTREQYERDRRVVAWHEAGHAVMTWLLGEPISRAGIQGTSSGVGGAVFGADRETQFMTRDDFRKQVKICYAGRASEQIKFNSVTTGASNDITQATELLKAYVENLGFDNDFGVLDISALSRDHLVNTSSVISSISALSKELYAECENTLRKNFTLVDVLAERLLAEESMTGTEINECLTYVAAKEKENTHA